MRWLLFIVVIIGVSAVLWLSVSAQNLQKVQASVAKKYPQLNHIQAGQFSKEIDRQPDNFVIFDVRERQEYEISHLPGAIWVEPGMSRTVFLNTHGQNLAGKTAVFYCSVGRRSSDMLSRVHTDLTQKGAPRSYNLTGGIFAWHNEGYGLVNDISATENIHPYNSQWGKLIERRDHISYKP